MTDKLPEDDQPVSIPAVREDDALIDEIEHYDGPSPLLRKLSQLAKDVRDACEDRGPLTGFMSPYYARRVLGRSPYGV